MKSCNNTKDFKDFFENISPIKLTECRYMRINSSSWGILTDYFIESVKINRYKPNDVLSTAILKIGDGSGQVTCLVKGKIIGLLFGLTEEEWSEIENMCGYGKQLFYRYFKDGVSQNFNCEQKIFYNFCHSNQTEDVVIAVFFRSHNNRNKNKHDAFLQITQLIKHNGHILDLYIRNLK